MTFIKIKCNFLKIIKNIKWSEQINDNKLLPMAACYGNVMNLSKTI